jgi:hypothetical protein
MASRKPAPMCLVQIACDGANLQGPRRDMGICGKCSEAQERRLKKAPPLKGENTALPVEVRRIDALKAAQQG